MKLSVIIPVYNTKAYLHDTVSSVLCQEGSYEIVLVDDGSTDGSGELCDELALDPRVKAYHQENQYVGAARNLGLSKAQGEYIYFLDSDDTMNDCISVLDGKTADVVSSTVRYEKGKRLVWTDEKDGEGLFLFSPYLGQSFYKREYLLRKGVKFSTERKTAEDCEWLFSILDGASIETADVPFYHYLEQREGSLCTYYKKEAILPTIRTWKKLFDLVDESSYPRKEELKAYCADGLIQHLIRASMVEGRIYDAEMESSLPYLKQKGCKIAPVLFLTKLIGVRSFFRLLNVKMKLTPVR